MKISILLILVIFLISCNQKKKTPQWYENGNLHQSNLSDWASSTEENKLATCADFTAKLKESGGQKYNSMDELKSDAVYLKECIDEVAKNPDFYNQSVVDIAAGCKMMEALY